MGILDEIITVLRIAIIPLGVVFRVIFCLTKMIYDEDAQGSYKKKIKNTIIFGILAELVFVILDIIQGYYGYIPTSSGITHGGGGKSF